MGPQPNPGLHVRIEAQRAQREVLPWAGQAALDLWLDGAPVATGLRLATASPEALVLSIGHAAEPHDAVLDVVLATDSDTTVRVYSVEVFVR